MAWLGFWVVLLLVSALGTLASLNSLRFGQRVAREARELWQGAAAPRPLDRAKLDALPAPVARYLTRALGGRRAAVRAVRLRHGGEFHIKPDGAPAAIRGVQYFATDPPGFVWWGRVRIVPGLWVDARDRSIGGAGSMLVRLGSTVTLADVKGPELDQGALLRLLAEMAWFPTALLDERYVTWNAIDARQAHATLRLADREVSCVFRFCEDGLPTRISADRYRDLGGGRSALTAWSGELADYREVAGMLVPHEVTPCWHLEGRRVPYACFKVERLEYDEATPY